MAASRFSFLLAAALVASGAVFAETEILFEDTFDGPDGTVLATGSEETYRIVGRDGTLMTPTLEAGRLALSIGPNPSEANNFSALHHNTRFDFQAQPLLFEVDVDLGDRRNFVFALHRGQNQTRIEANGNTLTVGFYNEGARLLLTARDPAGEETVRFENPNLPHANFRLGVFLDETDVQLLIDGIPVFEGTHGLSPEAFDAGAYSAFQLHGGGEGQVHTAYFDNFRVIANPDLTPEPMVVISDTFDGEDGEIPLTAPSPYRTAIRTDAVLGVFRENDQLKVTMGPNDHSASTFAMVHHNERVRFDQTGLLYEVDVDPGDMTTVAIGLHDWLGNETLMYGNNVSVTVYGDRRLSFGTRNGGELTEAQYSSAAGAFDRKFRLGLYLDETDVTLLVDGEIYYDGPHYLAQSLLDNGVYFGIQVYGGESATQAAFFDNLKVTAYPDMTEFEILPGDIFWSTDTAIRSLHAESGRVQTVVGALGRPIGVAVDFDNEHVYWVEHDTGLLMRADTDGRNVTEIRSDLDTGQFLALDSETNELFWAEWTVGLYSSPIDGGSRNLLVSDSGNGNAGVAVTEDTAYLISANTGAVTSFARDGSWTTDTVTTFAGQSYGIALDPSGREMYATNFSDGWIRAYDLVEGTSRTVWDEGLDRPLGIAVSSDGERLFWAERTADVSNGRIRVANSDGSGTVETLVDGESSPFGIAVRPFSQAPAGFAGWIAGFDLADGEDGPDDAPAGDGIPNLLKYALGLHPLQSARELLPQPQIRELDGHEQPGTDHLTLTVERNPDASGIEFVFEVSSDLVNWSSDEADILVVEEGDTLTAWSTSTIDEEGRQFLRFRVVTE